MVNRSATERKRRQVTATYNGHQGGHMRVSTVRELRDNATALLKSKVPVLITRRGRMAGVFFP
jgi:hypothetical protein